MHRLDSLAAVLLALTIASCADDAGPVSASDTMTTMLTTSATGSSSGDQSSGTASTSADSTVTTANDSGSGSDGPTTGVDSGSSGATDPTTGDSADGSSSDTSACDPLTQDVSAIGQECIVDGDCPEAYSCIDAGGVVAQPLCRIACTMDCECPDGLTCQVIDGKARVGNECRQ